MEMTGINKTGILAIVLVLFGLNLSAQSLEELKAEEKKLDNKEIVKAVAMELVDTEEKIAALTLELEELQKKQKLLNIESQFRSASGSERAKAISKLEADYQKQSLIGSGNAEKAEKIKARLTVLEKLTSSMKADELALIALRKEIEKAKKKK